MMQKVVLSLDVHDNKKCQKKAMKRVSSILGIDSISMDIKEKKMTLMGNMDPLEVVNELRKTYYTDIITIGPAEEPEKPKDKAQVTEPVNAFDPYNYNYSIYPGHYCCYYCF